MKKTSKIIIYQAKTGAIELRGDYRKETIWATLDQIAAVFGRNKSVISRHLKHIFAEGELNKSSVVAKNATTATDGKIYQVDYYNLDAIISVGYRVNSKTATKFRTWATKTLRDYIVDGYAINKNRIARNYEQFLEAVRQIKALLPKGGQVDAESALELVSAFADTWVSLEAYDEDKLAVTGATKRAVALTAGQLAEALATFKQELRKKGEVGELFGVDRRAEGVSGIVGNIMQSFGGKPIYATVEEKAAHLLYFMVKNHPFTDGNKRCGAYAFIWFLKKAGIFNSAKITPPALTALTLFIAESDSPNKERMVRLILQLLR